MWILKVVLFDLNGNEEVVDPGQVLPVEFFKARSIIARVFFGKTEQTTKDNFAKAILARLSGHPWSGFDETFAAAKMRDPVRLQIEAWKLDLHNRDHEFGFRLLKRIRLYDGPTTND